MLRSLRWLTVAAIPMFVTMMSSGPAAQGNPEPLGFKFNSGQSVQPIFEGWAYNQDGSVSMYFGYINRNYVEALAIPVGPGNKISPGEPDPWAAHDLRHAHPSNGVQCGCAQGLGKERVGVDADLAR